MKRLSLLAASLLIATPALAAGAHGGPRGEVPSDHNATTSQPSDAFSALDTDHDGLLSGAEMAKHPKAAHMAMVDENGDGALSPEEFAELQAM